LILEQSSEHTLDMNSFVIECMVDPCVRRERERVRNHEQKQNLHDHDETRTRNLLIRSQTPYPLGHAAYIISLL